MVYKVSSHSCVEVIFLVYRCRYSYYAVTALILPESLSFWHLSYLVIVLVNRPLISGIFVGP